MAHPHAVHLPLGALLSPCAVRGCRYNMGDIHDFTHVWNEQMGAWEFLKDQPQILQMPGATGYV